MIRKLSRNLLSAQYYQRSKRLKSPATNYRIRHSIQRLSPIIVRFKIHWILVGFFVISIIVLNLINFNSKTPINTLTLIQTSTPLNMPNQSATPSMAPQSTPSADQIPHSPTLTTAFHQPNTSDAANLPKTNHESIASVANPIKKETWISQQNPNRYTIQILSGSEETAVISFIKKHQIENQSAYFRTQHNNKNWFSVVYGNYENNYAATHAIKTLPHALQHSQPWVRQFNQIQPHFSP